MDNRIIVKNKKQNKQKHHHHHTPKETKPKLLRTQLFVLKWKIKSVVKEAGIIWKTGRQQRNIIIEEEEIAPTCKKNSSGLSQTELPLPGNPSGFRKVEETRGKHKVCNQE